MRKESFLGEILRSSFLALCTSWVNAAWYSSKGILVTLCIAFSNTRVFTAGYKLETWL